MEHLYVRNCYVHNIRGIIDHASSAAKRTGGIVVETVDDSTTPTRFNDVFIENCAISTVDNLGIALNNKGSVSDYPGTAAWEAKRYNAVPITAYRPWHPNESVRRQDAGPTQGPTPKRTEGSHRPICWPRATGHAISKCERQTWFVGRPLTVARNRSFPD